MHEDITFSIVVVVMELLFMASLVAVVSKRLRFPFIIGLVIIGLLIGWFARSMPVLQPLSALKLTPDIVFFVFLPVLLFESAFNLDARSLMKNIPAVLMLAVPALLIATGVVAVLVHYLLGLPLWIALLSLSIMVLLKLVLAFTSNPLLLIDVILCGILLYGLGLKRQWAYSYAIFLALAGTALAMYFDMMYGMVALVMALDRALRHEPPKRSVYEDRGLVAA